MRISFDLDDTLICYQPGSLHEPPLRWYWGLIGGSEPLRRGAIDLTRRLSDAGWEIWVYTTSYRNPRGVRRWLWCHGVRVGRVINQHVHDRHLKRSTRDYPPSKNPAAFGIDLHVDDSEGVAIEGRRWGFRVVVVSPDDLAWADAVWSAAAAMRG